MRKKTFLLSNSLIIIIKFRYSETVISTSESEDNAKSHVVSIIIQIIKVNKKMI